MNDKKMMRGMSILMVLLALVMVASGVQAQEAADNENTEQNLAHNSSICEHWSGINVVSLKEVRNAFSSSIRSSSFFESAPL